MEELVNLIGSDSSASDISDKIKEILFTKASEKIDNIRPMVGSSLFGDDQTSEEQE